MATRRRPARMNVQTMYPNFHAEQHKHHVQQNNTMVLPGKRRERSGGTKRADFVHSTRPPSRNEPQRVPNRDDMDARHISSAERSRQAILPIVLKRSSNQHETMTPAGQSDSDFQTPIVIEPSLRPSSRQVALRGELSLTAPAWEDNNIAGISPRLRPLPFPTSLTRSAPSLLEATTARLSDSVGGESLQDLVVNARPRSRYARRELHRQGSAKNLARISTAPSILRGNQSLDGTSMTARVGTPLINSRSTGNLLFDLSRRPANHQDAQVAVINTVEAFALEEKDRELEARVYANLGNLALAQLNFGHALSCHHRDLYLCSSKVLDCRLGRARAHKNLSIVYAKLHRRNLQLNHEKEARTAAYHNGGAYLYDITNHANTSVGNICLQSSTTIDPALKSLVNYLSADRAAPL
ncbi:hypothetical protein PHMEG_00032499 [Phytophthora megakarya]|uniref:Uncharacterized protein n=1 Tax=Phytophthora megakarya TaxID=4795 RepID=A0A225UVU1_9STRA|nr:hypothetical protein PHMEG_00032499 [Phytophthora megakarya]